MMLEKFINRRYGQAGARALLGQQPGRGEVDWPGRGRYESPIAVYAGPDAVRYIACGLPPGPLSLPQDLRVEGVRVEGTISGGRRLAAIRCRPTGFDFKATGEGSYSIIVLRADEEEMVLESLPEEQVPFRVDWTLINALFDGIEWTPRETGAGCRSDTVTFNSDNRQWRLRWHPALEDGDRNDLSSGILSALPTATLSTELPERGALHDADEEAFAITRLLSLVTGSSVGGASRRVNYGEAIVRETFVEWPINGSARNYTNHSLIGNNPGLGGALREFLNQTVGAYRRLDPDLGLSVVIGYLEQARSNPSIEIRLALSVFALEALTHRLCLPDGMTEEQLEKQNIEQKLNRLRGRLRMGFIDKKFVGEARRDIRNPLLHTGQIPTLSLSEKIEWYHELYALAFKMLLFLLGYSGRWLDPSRKYQPTEAPQ